jgi:hypothetical protein
LPNYSEFINKTDVLPALPYIYSISASSGLLADDNGSVPAFVDSNCSIPEPFS